VNAVNRKRLQLILILTVFLGPIIVAFVLRQTGWQPERLRNVGELQQPPRDVSDAIVTGLDGNPFAWRDPEYRWTLLLLSGPDCARACRERLADTAKIRALLTQKAARLRIAILGVDANTAMAAQYPHVTFLRTEAAALRDLLPREPDTVGAIVVDPAGLYVLRFAPGYDPAGVRSDLARLIR
jgi:hypothetical protein